MIEGVIVIQGLVDLKIPTIGVWIVVEAAVAAEVIDLEIDEMTVVMAIVVDMVEGVMMIEEEVVLMTVVVVDMMIDVAVDMMIDAAVVVDLTVIEVMVAVEGMT